MANAQYPLSKNAFLNGSISLSTATVKAVLVDLGTYTYSAAHQFLSDLTGTTGTAGTLTSKTIGTIAAGVFDAADTALGTPSVSAEALVVYIDTGVAGTSPLWLFLDTGVGGLPASAGGACTAVWNVGGIFAA